MIISYGVASVSDISSKNYIQVGAGLADTGTRYKDCQFQFGYGHDIAFNGNISVMPFIGVNYYRFDRGVDDVVFEDFGMAEAALLLRFHFNTSHLPLTIGLGPYAGRLLKDVKYELCYGVQYHRPKTN